MRQIQALTWDKLAAAAVALSEQPCERDRVRPWRVRRSRQRSRHSAPIDQRGSSRRDCMAVGRESPRYGAHISWRIPLTARHSPNAQLVRVVPMRGPHWGIGARASHWEHHDELIFQNLS